ncbi:MAG: ABC transporter permease subunit [Polyangiaceae bacterium]
MCALVARAAGLGATELFRSSPRGPRSFRVSTQLLDVHCRGGDKRHFRCSRRLGARALSIPRSATGRCHRRSPIRVTNGRRWYCPDDVIRKIGLARGAPPRARCEGRIHTVRDLRRAHVHRHSLRRAHRAARTRRSRSALEEAAAVLGAGRWRIRKVVLPTLLPSILTGFALAFARGIGEYGSVVFISGNMPGVTEIAPLLIVTKLEQYQYASATAIACMLLLVSFVTLLGVNVLQRYTKAVRS